MPYIFAGLRIATTLSVLGAIVAEYLAASNGLGYLVLSGSFNFNTARSFAAIILLAVIGTVFFWLMSVIEAKLSWKRRAGGDQTVPSEMSMAVERPLNAKDTPSTASIHDSGISITNIDVVYGYGGPEAVTALEGINLEIGDGEFVSLIGPRAAGRARF